MARPKKHPDELKRMVAISLTLGEIKRLDENIDYIRKTLFDSYELSEEQMTTFNALFNRSAIIREFISLMTSQGGYRLILGSMMAALDSFGLQKKDNDKRSVL